MDSESYVTEAQNSVKMSRINTGDGGVGGGVNAPMQFLHHQNCHHEIVQIIYAAVAIIPIFDIIITVCFTPAI